MSAKMETDNTQEESSESMSTEEIKESLLKPPLVDRYETSFYCSPMSMSPSWTKGNSPNRYRKPAEGQIILPSTDLPIC